MTANSKAFILGLTGGIACGISSVAARPLPRRQGATSASVARLVWGMARQRGGTISAVIYNDVCVNPDPIIGADTGDYLHAEQRKRFPQALWLECPRLSPEELGQ